MISGRFVGIGVGTYADPAHRELPHAVQDAKGLRALLGAGYAGEPLLNPTKAAVDGEFQALIDTVPGGCLVVLWSGHGVEYGGVVMLRAADSVAHPSSGTPLRDLALRSAAAGAGQMFVIVGACFAGRDVGSASDVAASVLQAYPPDAPHTYVGVLASCSGEETAKDGLFGARLRSLLADGPKTPELRVRAWSRHHAYVTGDDLGNALLADWDSDLQRPQFRRDGCAWWMFPNPRYDAGAPEQVVEHLLQAARSGASLAERSWFTGRMTEVDLVVSWIRGREPGVYVVTGSAGTGKSAIIGRVVSMANPDERGRLLGDGHRWAHHDPGEGSVHAHAHARGLTADRLADLLGEQLVRRALVPPQEGRCNANQLLGQVQQAVEEGGGPPVLVIDGLDEARGQAFGIAEELLVRLAPYAVVIVSTRELRRDDGQPTLVATLAQHGQVLDLDEAAALHRGQADLRDYVAARLATVDPRMDADLIAGYLAGAAAVTGSRPFLLARVVTDQLRTEPIDTTVEGWQDTVSNSMEAAFERDLAGTQPLARRAVPAGWSAARLARHLLTALTWGYGAGLPEEEWLTIANATLPAERVLDPDDVTWVLDRLGRYVVQDGEDGVAVYRVTHQSLADQLRPPYRASVEQPFDPTALPVTSALLDRYHALLDAGIPAVAPAYLWRYAWRHVVAAGWSRVSRLRLLAAADSALRPDVGLTDVEIAETFRWWGRHREALAPTEQAATIYPELAADNPAYLPNLAMALNNLGNRYSELGRRHDALAPTEQAATIYRELAADNPAYLPNLAMALNNLGNRYSELGRRHDALAPTEQAATIYRELAADNPAYLPNLAMALNNLGNRYSELGQPLRTDGVWWSVLVDMDSSAAAYLLMARSQAAAAGLLDAVSWLATALRLAESDRDLIAALHEEARRHREADQAAFDAEWSRLTSAEPPRWLAVDPELLATAGGWITTSTYPEERDHLTRHPELLEAAAGLAVEEALLPIGEDDAQRYRGLLAAARTGGVEGAYRPLLLRILAADFIHAEPATQRALLADRREDLLSDLVGSMIDQWSSEDDTGVTPRAAALLWLARLGEHEPALDALEHPNRFSGLLHRLAVRPDPAALQPTALIAYTAATTPTEGAIAAFYLAVSEQLHDTENEVALATLAEARRLDPARTAAWINDLATIGRTHPAVLSLIPSLTAPPADAAGANQ